MSKENTECVSHNDSVNPVGGENEISTNSAGSPTRVQRIVRCDSLFSDKYIEAWLSLILFANCFLILGSSWYRGLFIPLIEPIINCLD